jgi:elongation factor P
MNESAGNLKKGDYIKYRDELWQILNKNFSFHGRGLANVKLKIKSIKSSKSIELSIKSGQEIEKADISITNMTYLYKDNDMLYFMDKNYEQYSLLISNVGNFSQYLIDGEKYYIVLNENKAINIRQPEKVILKVTEASKAIKGDTTGSAKKLVVTQTGTKILVPLFIKSGDIIVVNPENGEYIERKNT